MMKCLNALEDVLATGSSDCVLILQEWADTGFYIQCS